MSHLFNTENAATAAYVVAALLFILALAGLSKHETSRAGNSFGITGMAVALVATIALAAARHISPLGAGLLIGAMAIGAAIGLWRAKVVEMTGMPELIALLHSFVGLAAVLVGWVALRAQAPLERMQITYGLVAVVFALAAVVLYSPGAAAILSGACLLIGVFNFWMALNSKGAESAA